MIHRKTILSATFFAAAAALLFLCSYGATAQIPHNDEFVKHDGAGLTLGGEPFRYSGPNIEWLGIENYGPSETMGPRYPSHFEVDDALDTAKIMGARVVRSQTLGDSVGCDLCIEPKAGEFNPEAFKVIDYAVKAAHDRGLRLVVTLIGDCTYCDNGGIGQYVEWAGSKNMNDFLTDPKLIAMFEKHIAALLNHKSTITGIALKDDPTIMAWENCNMCGLIGMMSGPNADLAPVEKWVDTIGGFIKSIDNKHLYSDNSGLFLADRHVLDDKTPDLVTAEYYPHFNPVFGGMGFMTTAGTFSQHAALITAHGKAYSVCEFGWDVTNWPTRDDFQAALTAMEKDPKISGNGFWALYAHAIEYGWQPMVMPTNDIRHAKAALSDTGQWWSFYYGGIDTLVNSRDEMRARAEMLRTHAFKMAGLEVPPHPVPETPVITTKSLGIVRWRGVAGAVNYSVERQGKGGKWEVVCDKCATDADMGWPDLHPAGLLGGEYRVIAWNADGVPSAQPASDPVADAPAASGVAHDLTGHWVMHGSIAGNDYDLECDLSVAGGTITGSCTSDDKAHPVKGSVDGDKAAWQYESEYQGTPITLTYTTTLSEEKKLAGSVDVQPFNVTGDFTGAIKN